MPSYSLRTLLLVALIAGPLLAWGWGYVERVIEERRAAEAAVGEAERVAEAARKDKEELLRLIIGYPNPQPIDTEADMPARTRGMQQLYVKLNAAKLKAAKAPQ